MKNESRSAITQLRPPALRAEHGQGAGGAERSLFATDTFIWGLAAICHLSSASFCPDLILQQFPPPYGTTSLQEAAAALKIESGCARPPLQNCKR